MAIFINFPTKMNTKTLLKKISTILHFTRSKGSSSHEWLSRQHSDPYVEKAKTLNYRCRSAFKLIEIDERFKIFQPGQVIVDCGSSPGSWSQVAVRKVNSDGSMSGQPQGFVVSIDKQTIYPIDGATILGNVDFVTNHSTIMEVLDRRRADGVISDMAPNATGVRDLDTENIINLCYSALRFALLVSQPGAFLIVKLWQCGQLDRLKSDISKFYNSLKVVKPNSSRADSAEVFLLARNFKGLSRK